MKLITLNVYDERFVSLTKRMSDGKGDELLFFDWNLADKSIDPQKKSHNLLVLESTPKNVRIVIFDRYCALTDKEASYFLKRGSVLLEPRVTPRPGFLFMPYWIHKNDLPLSMWDKKRPFDVGFKGSSLDKCCESILAKSVKEIKDVKVGVSVDNKIPKERYDIVKEIMSIGQYKWNDFKCSVICTDTDYGILPDIRNHLNYGVIPLLSPNYKWYHAVFKKFIIDDINTIRWYIKMYSTCGYGFIEEIYKNINDFMPEMVMENFIQSVISLSKR